mgnify:CR=1 FL=1
MLNPAVHVIQAKHPAAVAFLQEIEREIDRDGVNPRVEAALAPEAFQIPEGPGKNFLEEIVGILPMAGHVINQRVETLAVFEHESVEGRAIAFLRALHEHAVLLFIGQDSVGHTKGAIGCRRRSPGET